MTSGATDRAEAGSDAAAAGSAAEPDEEEDVPEADGADAAIPVRLVMPDRWLEHVEELRPDTTVEEAKRVGLRKMLLRDTDRPDDFYVEYAERQVPDETVTLEALGVQPREILSIRAYDLGHYPRFDG